MTCSYPNTSSRSKFGDVIDGSYVIPSLWLGLWSSFIQVGAMIGAIISGPISNSWGGKITFALGGIIVISGVFLVYFADICNTLLGMGVAFLFGKTIEGCGLAVMNATCLTFISEIAPERIRGPLLSCFTLFAVVGQIVGVVAVYAVIDNTAPTSYRSVFAVQWGLALLIIIVAIIVPESPVYLVKRNKLSRAAAMYKRMHPKADVEKEITYLKTTIDHEMEVQKTQKRSNLFKCFQGTDFRRTRIIIYANVLQQFVGVTMVANATYFLELGGMSASLSLTLTIVELALGIPSIMASWFSMTILGRRAILFIGSVVSFILWLSMGIAGCFQDTSSAALWYIGIILIVIFVVYSLSVGAAYPVVAAETSSLHLRATSQSIGFFFQFFFAWAFSLTIPYMYNVDSGDLGGRVGFVFAGFAVIAITIVWFEIPEMKHRTIFELDEMFEKKIPTRQFKKYVRSGSDGMVEDIKPLEERIN